MEAVQRAVNHLRDTGPVKAASDLSTNGEYEKVVEMAKSLKVSETFDSRGWEATVDSVNRSGFPQGGPERIDGPGSRFLMARKGPHRKER
ncbi:MAG: hypothetical protein ABSF90_26510 [Syntrophobacteraceae bacterium]|jgi:hypothetical protein